MVLIRNGEITSTASKAILPWSQYNTSTGITKPLSTKCSLSSSAFYAFILVRVCRIGSLQLPWVFSLWRGNAPGVLAASRFSRISGAAFGTVGSMSGTKLSELRSKTAAVAGGGRWDSKLRSTRTRKASGAVGGRYRYLSDSISYALILRGLCCLFPQFFYKKYMTET